MSSLSSFFSSFFPSAECEAPSEDQEGKPEEGAVVQKEDSSEEGDSEEAREEEDAELEDPLDVLREECKESGGCRKFTEHFAHCQEKVEAGEGFKGEDCVEEMFHMMHCVDNCVAPRLFAKLK